MFTAILLNYALSLQPLCYIKNLILEHTKTSLVHENTGQKRVRQTLCFGVKLLSKKTQVGLHLIIHLTKRCGNKWPHVEGCHV